MRHTYQTENVCSTEIAFDLNGDVVSIISFTGGCNGISKHCKGLTPWKTLMY